MRIKKLISIFLSIVIVALALPVIVMAENSSPVADNAETMSLLTYLEIVDYPMDESLYGVSVTRADFAVYVGKMIGITEKNVCDKRYYTDLPEDHWGYHTINTMTQSGILRGSDGKFRPEDNITYQEALVMLLNAIGYNSVADVNGGYPSGYNLVANNLDISVAGANYGQSIDFKTACELIFDALHAPVVEYSAVIPNGGSATISKSETVMGELFDIYQISGVVNSSTGVSIDAKSACGKDVIRIGNVEYFCNVNDALDFLGKKVSAYYMFDGVDDVVFLIIPKNDEECIEINISDFVDYDEDTNSIIYNDNNDKEKKKKISAGSTIIRNYENYSSRMSEAFENLQYGTILLTSSLANGNYDTVIIKNYENMVVSSFDKGYEKIFDKINQSYILDVSKFETLKILDENGKATELKNIENDSVLSVCKSEDFCEIIVSTVSYNGAVTKVTTTGDDNCAHVFIDDVDVPVDKNYYDTNQALFTVGTKLKIFVNTFDVGVFAQTQSNTDYAVGYVIKVIEGEEWDTMCYIKMLTQTGTVETYNCAEKISVDNSAVSSYAELESSLENQQGEVNGQVVRYKLNSDDKIIRIETAAEIGEEDDSSASLRMDSSVASARYYSSNMMLGPTIKLTSSTICFSVPAPDENGETDIKDYGVINASGLANDNTYSNITSYKTSNTTNTAEIIVMKASNVGNWGKSIYLIERLYDVWDEDENEMVRVADVYSNGTKSTIRAAKGFSFEEAGISPGDVWHFYRNSNGEITYESSGRAVYKHSTKAVNNFGASFSWEPYISYGYVSSIKEGVAKYGCRVVGGKAEYANESLWTQSGLVACGGTAVTIFHSHRNTVEIGSEADLYDAMNERNLVIVTQTYGTTQSIIVIK